MLPLRVPWWTGWNRFGRSLAFIRCRCLIRRDLADSPSDTAASQGSRLVDLS